MLFACPATEDFFRSRIDHMIDLRHPLAVLASRMPWQQIEASVAHLFSRKARSGQAAMPDLDLFGEAPAPVARTSNAGRPRVPLRVMISLLYLKHAFNESDEAVVARWADTPRWQFFSGCAYYEDRQPCDATTLVKFRQLLGEEGVQELLAQTINVAVQLKLIKPQELTRVIVDSTVQEKAIAHPTDSRLLETARTKLVEAAQDAGIGLKQTFAKEGKDLSRKAGRYAHARQFKRMRRAIKRQRTIVGRLQRRSNARPVRLAIHRLEVLLHYRVHVPLVGLEAQHVVRPMSVQLFGDGFLAAHGIDGDDAALQMQQPQQLGNGRDLIALAINLALAQQEPHVGGPGADQMQRPGCIALAAAAHALAVDGHRALHLACHLGQPLPAGQLQLLGIEQAKHAREGVVRGNAAGQGYEAGEPVLVLLAELSHLHPVVRSCNGGA